MMVITTIYHASHQLNSNRHISTPKIQYSN